MKRWNSWTGTFVENEKIDDFLNEIASICAKHKMTISHEDGYGAFIIEEFNDENIKWLLDASNGVLK